MDFESAFCMSLLLVRAKRRHAEENRRNLKSHRNFHEEAQSVVKKHTIKGDVSTSSVPAKKQRFLKKGSAEDYCLDEGIECAEDTDSKERIIKSEVECQFETEYLKEDTELFEPKGEFRVYIDVNNENDLHEEHIVKEEIDDEYVNTNEGEFNNVDTNDEDSEVTDKVSRVRSVTSYKENESLLKAHFHSLHFKLKETPELFYNQYRMSINTFDELLTIIRPRISRKDTNMRKPVTPETRLSVTLRYLATGNGCHMLSKEYLLGSSTISQIIRETCREIWNALKDHYFPMKNEQNWLGIAKEFYDVTNFPNCIGAVEGRQLRVRAPVSPDRQGKWSSILLLGVVDANYCFIDFDIINDISGEDGNIFKNSSIGKQLTAGKLKIPKLCCLPNDNGSKMPFIFVGDESLAISGNVLRPYSKRDASIARVTFNERLMKARQVSNRAFDILVGQWKFLDQSIHSKPENARDIIKSICVIHNFVMRRDSDIVLAERFNNCRLRGSPQFGTRGTRVGKEIRDYFANYFTLHPV